MKKINPSASIRLAKMSLICAVMVVGLHVGRCAGAAGDMFLQVFVRGLFPIAVPFFFLASGYLLAKNVEDSGWYETALLKRLKTVFVPMVLVGVIFEIFEICLTVCANLIAGREWYKNFYQGWEWLRVVGIYPFDYPGMRALWFLRSLLICVLISTIIVWAVRRMGIAYLIATFIASAYAETMIKAYTPSWHLFCTIFSLRGIFWFSVGIYLMLVPDRFRLSPNVCKVLGALGLAVPLAICNIFEIGVVSRIVRYLAVPFVMIGVWNFLSDRKWDAKIVSLSFPIYLIHMFFIDATNCVGLQGDDLAFSLLLVKYAIAVLGAAVIAMAVRRFLPNFARILFGGR